MRRRGRLESGTSHHHVLSNGKVLCVKWMSRTITAFRMGGNIAVTTTIRTSASVDHRRIASMSSPHTA